MAKVEITTCDWAGCRGKAEQSFAVVKGRRTDGAGSMETIHDTFDLCSSHMGSLLNSLLKESSDARALVLRNIITREN